MKKAFTLIELLVVIAIIAVLAAVLYGMAVDAQSKPIWFKPAAIGIGTGLVLAIKPVAAAVADSAKGWGLSKAWEWWWSWVWRPSPKSNPNLAVRRFYIWVGRRWVPLADAEVYLNDHILGVTDAKGELVTPVSGGQITIWSSGQWLLICNCNPKILHDRAALGSGKDVYCVYTLDADAYLAEATKRAA